MNNRLLIPRFLRRIPEILILLAGVSAILFPLSPLTRPFPGRDSGVFLYTGWRILNGELPYRDVWDHKPPLIYFINSLGLALGDGSRWGVWALEFIFLFFAAWIGFCLLRKKLGLLPAVLGTAIWLLALISVIEGGNLATEYTLPLQFVALSLASRMDEGRASSWDYFFIGFTGGIAFFLKQTAIGIWLAVLIYILIQRLRSGYAWRGIRETALILLGAALPSVGILAYFAGRAGLPQLLEAAFKFNYFYSIGRTGILRLSPIVTGIEPLSRAGLLQFSLIGFIFGFILILYKRDLVQSWLGLLVISMIDLPLELVLISTPGFSYDHYYMTLLPAMSLFAALFTWVLLWVISSWSGPARSKAFPAILLLGIFIWGTLPYYKDSILGTNKGNLALLGYVRSNSGPDEAILVWGADASFNYITQRSAPTRFVYQTPLFTRGYVQEAMVIEFLDGILREQPRLIIDMHNPATPMYGFPIESAEIRERINELRSQYQLIGEAGGSTIYEFAGNDDLDLH